MIVEILENPLAPRIEGINQLVRPQLVQQLDAAVFDQVSVHGGSVSCANRACEWFSQSWTEHGVMDGMKRNQ